MRIDSSTLGISRSLAAATTSGATAASSATGPGGTSQLQRPGTTGGLGMTADDFMTLFLAQLKNQDPTQPMSDTDMIAQLAQFTMISTLTDLEHELAGARLAQSASLIGKTVTGVTADGSNVSGVVQQLSQTDGVLALIVDGISLSPDSITSVSPTATSTATPAAAAGSASDPQGSNSSTAGA
jgi:flagellar basal-body rod modification protein FlgD